MLYVKSANISDAEITVITTANFAGVAWKNPRIGKNKKRINKLSATVQPKEIGKLT